MTSADETHPGRPQESLFASECLVDWFAYGPHLHSSNRMNRMSDKNGDNGVAFGIIGGMLVGVLIFAITGQPTWIALGAGFGLPVGILLARASRPGP